MKPILQMDFDELVDYVSGELLKEILAGTFRTGVYLPCPVCSSPIVSES